MTDTTSPRPDDAAGTKKQIFPGGDDWKGPPEIVEFDTLRAEIATLRAQLAEADEALYWMPDPELDWPEDLLGFYERAVARHRHRARKEKR